MLKSKKLFNSSEQYKNATFVQFANNKIFAVGQNEARLHILDLALNTLCVADHQFEKEIRVMKSSESFVAIGEWYGNVTFFDTNGRRVLVSYF